MSLATKSRQLKLSIVITIALMVSAFPGLVFAQDPDSGPIDVDTRAEIDQGAGPEVVYKWELQNDPREGTSQTGPWLPENVMYPNLEDEDADGNPAVAQIGYWWIAKHDAGINAFSDGDGFIRVFHPDGSLKYQLHGVQKDCTYLGHETNQVGSLLWALVERNSLTVADAQSIRSQCEQNQLKIWNVFGEISKHQPHGDYLVRATAVDNFGATHTLDNVMEVGAIVGLEFDQQLVDYGIIQPNTPKWIEGSWDFGDTKPTVKNTGNALMYLRLHFSQMVGADFEKIIDEFDATLRWRPDPADPDSPQTTQTYDPIAASTPVCFDQVPLGSNEVGKLDLSIHPGSLPADVYWGELELTGWLACP